MSNGKGDTYRPVDRKKYDEGYLRAFGLCKNDNCEVRFSCYRWLRTPRFDSDKVCFPGGNDCQFYVKCTTKKDYERMENG